MNYRWLPALTIPMVQAIVRHCGILPVDDVMDFGCARGYVVRAFRSLGYNAFGVDVSKWAVEHCDPEAAKYVSLNDWRWADFDWIIAKDVLEHVPDVQETINRLMERCNKGLFVVVPLAVEDGSSYLVQEYEADVTHIHRLTLPTWHAMFQKPGWKVLSKYRVHGVKDNYAQYEHGNGFITAVRVKG